MDDPEKVGPVTPCIDVYKAKVQYDDSLEKLKLRIVAKGYFQKKEIIGDTWDPTESMRTLKYFSGYSDNYKAR